MECCCLNQKQTWPQPFGQSVSSSSSSSLSEISTILSDRKKKLKLPTMSLSYYADFCHSDLIIISGRNLYPWNYCEASKKLPCIYSPYFHFPPSICTSRTCTNRSSLIGNGKDLRPWFSVYNAVSTSVCLTVEWIIRLYTRAKWKLSCCSTHALLNIHI